MADPIRILGIAGSLRAASYNRGALRAAQKLMPAGAALEVFELAGIPVYNQDEERNPPQKVADFKARIRGRRHPHQHRGIYWTGKPVAVMSASVGQFGGMRAQYHLRRCFVLLNMDAVLQPEVAIANASQRFDEQGNLTDETSKQLIGKLLQALMQKAQASKMPVRAAA
jgi:chromate reductase